MIAHEGYIIVLPLVFLNIFLFILYIKYFSRVKYLFYLSLFFLVFSLYFFRDPSRTGHLNSPENYFLSPADGKVVLIKPIKDDYIGDAIRLSIFLSVFDVHKQLVPITSKAVDSNCDPGLNLAAFDDEASDLNVSCTATFETEGGLKYKIKQITGLIARRIVNYIDKDEIYMRGDRLGFIRFGSRVDIVLPKEFNFHVNLGDNIKAGETIIGVVD